MKKSRIFVLAIIAILLAVLAIDWFDRTVLKEPIAKAIGGPFELVRTDGTPISHEDIKGEPHAIFFGFTNCPEVCPTTLFEVSGWLKELGDDADKLTFYFFSVDPERDTKEVLAEYVGSFDPRIVGVTGGVENMKKAIAAYFVFVKKIPLEDGDYTIDHTASVYLMDADGGFSGTISYGESSDTALEKLRKLVN